MKSASKSKILIFFAVLAIILLLIFFNRLGWLSWPRSLTVRATKPILRLFQSVDSKIGGAWNFFVTLKDLNNENIKLRRDNEELLGETARLKEVDRENEALRRQLEVGPRREGQIILASVIGYNFDQSQYFLIDKGARDGLSVGMAVIVSGNFLIGRLAEVEQNLARVVLISDRVSSVNVLTQDSRISGVVRGSHGLGVFMEMIPIDSHINVGELILTSGLNGNIPTGLVVGRVADVFKKENEIFQRAGVNALVDAKNLQQVFVLTE